MDNLVGRSYEKRQFEKYSKSRQSEFVVVYGRRRVGKTFLIREFFNNNFHFQLTGLANATTHQQLVNFNASLKKYSKNNKLQIANNWFEAFLQLGNYLEKNKDKRKVIFIDELPWLDTHKSDFISSLEHFWNSWASARKDILLLTCGSAATWIMNKLINNKGGLHNRITQKIKLQPFTLSECELFFKSKNIVISRYQIIEAYMAMGGIPYYLNEMQKGLSIAQNLDTIFFTDNGLLQNEFNNLYASLFKNSDKHVAIVTALAKKAKGLTRNEIIKISKLTNGGSTSKILDELEISGFIRKYISMDKKLRESIYQLTDFYTLFYFKFIHNNKNAKPNFWLTGIDSPERRSWSGYAFEQICLSHITQIKKELGINGVQTNEASWLSNNAKSGTQIDLLIDRKDNVINLCEMKFSINRFNIDKKYANELRNKIGTFKTESKTKKAVHLTMISTYGTTENEYANELVQNNLTMNCLFA